MLSFLLSSSHLASFYLFSPCCYNCTSGGLWSRAAKAATNTWNKDLVAVQEGLGEGGAGEAHHGTPGRCAGRAEWHQLPVGLKGARVSLSGAESTGTPGLALVLLCRGDALLTVTHFWGLCWRANSHQKYLWLNSDHGGIIRVIHKGNLAWRMAQLFN